MSNVYNDSPKFLTGPLENVSRCRLDAGCLPRSNKTNRAAIGRRMAEILSCRAFTAKSKTKPNNRRFTPVTFLPYRFEGCCLARLRDLSRRMFDMQANLLSRKTTKLGAQKCDFSHFYNFELPKLFRWTRKPPFRH